ncbi:hypothetical protein C8J57DRAFT_1311929 [Mycena rebaudengoi]|nr:hypothetical protein C8J57DRAFT_1311929 [Mycena rebaudengoi]
MALLAAATSSLLHRIHAARALLPPPARGGRARLLRPSPFTRRHAALTTAPSPSSISIRQCIPSSMPPLRINSS